MEITIKDYKVVKSADIKLDGFTVLCGDNGSGKTTAIEYVMKQLKDQGDSVVNINELMNEIYGNYINKTPIKISKQHSSTHQERVVRTYINKRFRDHYHYKNTVTDGGRVKNMSYALEDASPDLTNRYVLVLAALYKAVCDGLVTEDTVIVFDDAPGNLHPAASVEIAHIILVMRRCLKCRFLCSSHCPDFVSGIRSIAGANDEDENLNFYFSERQDDGTYTFIPCRTEITRMFESFNRSYDLINVYGTHL